MAIILLPGKIPMSAGDVKHLYLDFTKNLEQTGSTISTAAIDDVTGITVINEVGNSQTFTNDNGNTVAIGKGVKFTATAASNATGDYVLTGTFVTANSETWKFRFTIEVP